MATNLKLKLDGSRLGHSETSISDSDHRGKFSAAKPSGESSFNRSSMRTAMEIISMLAVLLAWEIVLINYYFHLHGVDLKSVIFHSYAIPALEFITADPIVALLVEVVAWAGTAVVVRRVSKLARDARKGKFNFAKCLTDFISDFVESVFLTYLLVQLLRIPKITLGTGINISLAGASIDVIITFACVLGWSVHETRILLTRVLHVLVGRDDGSSDATDG